MKPPQGCRQADEKIKTQRDTKCPEVVVVVKEMQIAKVSTTLFNYFSLNYGDKGLKRRFVSCDK